MLKLLGKHVFLVGIFLILTIHTASAQLLGLALSLGNTLAGYIFDIYLRTENTLDIDGAPNWYLRMMMRSGIVRSAMLQEAWPLWKKRKQKPPKI